MSKRKRSTKHNTVPLLDEDDHLPGRDADKIEAFNAFFFSFFASIFNTDYHLWGS